MSHAISLVVFDMAGTTVYDGDAVHASLQKALAGAGVSITRDEANAVMGIAKPVAIAQLLQSKGEPANEERIQRIYHEFLEIMTDYYRSGDGIREIEGTTAAFEQLTEAGVKIALDTGFSRQITDAILERLTWLRDGLLSATVSSDEVNLGRPHPDMIFRAMEVTGVTDVQRVAKVGDTPSDLHEGTNAGCRFVIGVTEGSHTEEQLRPHPHTHLVPNITHVPAILIADGSL